MEIFNGSYKLVSACISRLPDFLLVVSFLKYIEEILTRVGKFWFYLDLIIIGFPSFRELDLIYFDRIVGLG